MGKNRTIKRLLFGLLIWAISLIAAQGYANAQITEADLYTSIDWKCLRANPDMKFQSGKIYLGEAYWYSGHDSIGTFTTKIESGTFKPGGLIDATGANDRAGIDCSGFVTRIWGGEGPKLGTSTIVNYSRKITKEDLQRGDILNSCDDHVIIFDRWADSSMNSLWVYHARVGNGDPNYDPVSNPNPGNMVAYEELSWDTNIVNSNHNYIPRRKGATAPESCNIDNGSVDVALKPTVTVQLNGPVKEETVNADTVVFKAYDGGDSIPGQISYADDSRTISFVPAENLESNKKYRIKLKKEILDLEDHELDVDQDEHVGGEGNYEVAFTTVDVLGNLLQLISWNWQKTASTQSTSGMSAMSVASASSTLTGGAEQIDPGETFELDLTLHNSGATAISAATGRLSSSSSGIIVTNDSQYYGNIGASGEAKPANKFVFSVPADYSGQIIDFALYVSGSSGGQDYCERIEFSLPVGSTIQCPAGTNISEITDYGLYNKLTVDDSTDGNNNGVFDLGDAKADLIFYAGNSTASDIYAEFEIMVDDSKFIVNESRVKYMSIPAFSYVEVPYSISPRISSPTDMRVVVTMKAGGGTRAQLFDTRYGYVSWIKNKPMPPKPAAEAVPKMSSLVFGADGSMFAIKARDDQIVKYNQDMTVAFSVRDFNGEVLSYPLDIAYSDKYKMLLVADTYNARILVYDENGKALSKLEWPKAAQVTKITRTHQEYVWGLVRTNYETRVDKIDYQDDFLLIPASIDTNDGEYIYVSDCGTRKIFRYKLESDGALKPAAFTNEMDLETIRSTIMEMNDFVNNYEYDENVNKTYRDYTGIAAPAFLVPSNLSTLYSLNTWNWTNPIGWGLILVSWAVPSTKEDSLTFKINMAGIENPGGNIPLDVLAMENGYGYLQSSDGKLRTYDLHPMLISTGTGTSLVSSSAPAAVGTGSDGSIYVSDSGNNSIKKFNAEGVLVADFNGTELNAPRGVEIDSYGNVFVADTGNQRIVQFGPTGNFIQEYKSDEYEIDPQKLVVRSGKLYIADANHDRPLVWDIGGEITNFNVSDPWFSPNSDGSKDNLTVAYDLSQPANVTLQPIPATSEGTTVQSVYQKYALNDESRLIGHQQENWNGILVADSSGQGDDTAPETIADGNYQIKLVASFGDYQKTKTADIHVDTTAPEVSLTRAPPAISPNADSINDALIIEYSVSDNLSPSSEVRLSFYKDNRAVGLLQDQTETLPVASREVGWNGTFTGHVNEGYYILELKATDLAGNVTTATQEVLVDKSAPRIENVTLSNPYFSPNNDGRKDTTEISFNLLDTYAREMTVTVLVADQYEMHAADIAKQVVLTPGTHSFTWEGAAVPGSLEALVADGTYKIKIYAQDEAGNLGNSEPAEVVVDTIPPSVESFAASPNPFTPNNDGVKDTTLISFKLSEPCNSELRILQDDNVTLFRDQLYYDLSQGSFGWNGSGEHAEILGQEHPFYLYAEDRAGNVTTSETQTIIVDHEPSLVPYIYADPDPFAPVNPANAQTTIKYYLVRDGLTINLEVLGQDDRVVKTLLSNELQNKGEQSITWSGDFDPSYDGPKASADSNKVADGSWQFRITATASDEPNPAVTTNTVVVDNVAPYLLAENFSVDQVSCCANLTYSLPENASLEVAAFDSSDALIETIESLNYKTAGSHAVMWQPGTPPSGTAYIKVSAVDRALNSSELKTELFMLTAQGELAVTGLNASPNPFTPNGDGLIDLTQISYQVSGGAPEYNVGLVIETESGSTVKTILQNEPQNSGYYSFIWDGKNDSGQLVSDGDYQVVLTVEDKLGGRVEAQSGLLLVSTRPSLGLSISPAIISPNDDELGDTSTFTYSIDYPVAYITGEALIKFEVLTATGEALWSRTFNNSPGTYVYTYDGKQSNGDPLPAGSYYVKATAQDALGATAVPQTVDLSVDYTLPEPSDFVVDPIYTKLGTVMTISLSFVEELAEMPTVMLYMPDESSREAIFVSQSGNDYVFSYTIVEGDAEGNGVVEVTARDLADNPISRTKGFVVDTTQPTLSSLSVSPNPAGIPAVSGQVSIQFNVSEPLQSVPRVYVKQSGAGVQQALVSGDWDMAGGTCIGKYDIVSGYDGAVLITIEAIDLAGNTYLHSLTDSLTADTVDPVFSNIRSEIAANPDFSTYAKEGSTVTISFNSSEDLQFNPDVRVNGETADYVSLSAGQYTYSYVVDGYDSEGNAEISITGQDPAGNQGSSLTSSSSESFVIDLTNPLVDIAEPETDMIANPSPFMTNGQPGVDALQTTLYYTISEQGYVTIGVHKVPDAQTTYVRDDFTSANQVHSFDLGWQAAGQRHVDWTGILSQNAATYDENSNGYADPGKYAFIVEVRDRAGNLVEGKWGGTCWIQDNVLTLIEPNRTEIGNDNPRPNYFSPNSDTNKDSTEIFFQVNLDSVPSEVERPERIAVLSASATTEIKPIGTYTIRIYNASTSALVRNLVSDKELMSNKLISEVWDGKNNSGSYVPEGTYNVEIDARDYIGGAAMNNLLTLTATVDVTAPTIDSHEPQTAGDTAWINASRTFNVDLYDQHNAFASKLNIAEYKVICPDSSDSGWQDIFSTLEAGAYTNDWGSAIFGQAKNGVNTVYVKVNDMAGNETETIAFYVRKDAENPSSISPGTTSPTNDQTPTWTWAASIDNYSGVEGYYIKVGTTDGGADVVPETWIGNTTSWTHSTALSEGVYYAQVRARDNAGNLGAYASGGNSVQIDITPPVISVPTVSLNPFNQMYESTTINWSMNDAVSSNVEYEAAIYTTTGTLVRTIREFSHGLVVGGTVNYDWSGLNNAGHIVNEGSYTFKVRARDGVGNTSGWQQITIQAKDDINISNNAPNSTEPRINWISGDLQVQWIEGWDDSLRRSVSANVTEGDHGNSYYTVDIVNPFPPPDTITTEYYADKSDVFTVEASQAFEISAAAWGENSGGEYHAIKRIDGTVVWEIGSTGDNDGSSHYTSATIPPGTYYAWVDLRDDDWYDTFGHTEVWFYDRRYNLFNKTSANSGQNWSALSGPAIVFELPTSQTVAETSTYRHEVYVGADNNLWYRRLEKATETVWTAKLTNTGHATNPKIVCDSSNNSYVVWEDLGNDNTDIFFQLVPVNFAAAKGTATALKVVAEENQTTTNQAATFEAPVLISPDDTADVDSIRPTFQWDHHKGNATEYKVDLAKNDLFTIDSQTFIKSENTGSVDQTDPTLYHFTYAIHEFDPGLDRDTYYWRVTAYTTNETATSEVRSFTVAPELSLTGVTNYPNPFDPRRNTTRIRYRLATDVDSVVVRIYDIAGALVVELDNCPTDGEGSSVWQKYSDVEWDGRNGRGDLVVNGIYPFEVIARLGDRSVSARGKMAVLK